MKTYQSRAINTNQERKNSEKIELKFCTNATFQKSGVLGEVLGGKEQKKEKNYDNGS